jgi:dipeptidase E
MTRHIIACGGDGWPTDPRHPAMEERILAHARRDNPRVLLLPTASGDSDQLIARFYEFFNPRHCRPDHLSLFRPHPRRVDLAAQDVVYVGGGSTLNLMALLRLHDLADGLRTAYAGGTVMSGVSAGAICWFRWGLSNSGGEGYVPVEGLGLLPGGICPHADGDPGRLPALERAVATGGMPSTHALDDGAALVFADERLTAVVAARPGRGARRVSRAGDGVVWAAVAP